MAVKTLSDISKNGNTTSAFHDTQKTPSRKKTEKVHTENRLRIRFYISAALTLVRLISALRGGKRHSGLVDVLPRKITREGVVLEHHIREGKFQRSLSLITAFSSLLSGLEVTYEHYIGSYSQRIMYTPVFISIALFIAGVWGTFNRWVARVVLPIVSLITVIDGIIGFIFHVRGIQRKPGGWRIPIVNIVMGPPILAPILFATSGFLGLIASMKARG